MLTPHYLERMPDAILELYSGVEQEILRDMGRRLATYDYWIPAADWQARKLMEAGAVHDDIISAMSNMTGKSQVEVKRMMREAGAKTLASDAGIYSANGLNVPTIADSTALKNVLNAGYEATNQTMKNLTATTANTAARQFENALDTAWLKVQSGAFNTNTAVRAAIKALSKDGVGAITYPSGHVDQLEVAVRRAVVTGVNQTSARLQLSLADELGCDLVETTAHGGARPEHAAWQGQIFSLSGKTKKYPNFRQATGYGTGAGLCGWNCRHNFNPYFEGSTRAYSDKLLRAYDAKSISYNGEKLTEYEAGQRQRGIERQIRRWKRENAAMGAAGLDTTESAAKVKQWQAAQKDFVKQTGLKRQGYRENIAGHVDSALKRDILKLGKINEDVVAKMNFSEMADYVGKLSDRAARKWYQFHDAQIPDIVGTDGLLEDRARRACDLRNTYRTQTRDLMRDQEKRKELDRERPNKSFEQLLEQKMREKGMSRDQAIQDIFDTATKTNANVNKKFGLE